MARFEANPIGMFHTANTDALRAAGLAGGHVWVSFLDDALELRGDTGGVLRIGATDVERARIGFEPGRGGGYAASLWRADATEPIVLRPSAGTRAAYARAMLALAERCEATGRIDRIECGSSRIEALWPALLVIPLVLITLLIGAFIFIDLPWWVRTLLPLAAMVLFGVLLSTGLTRHWPRSVSDAHALRLMLPPLD